MMLTVCVVCILFVASFYICDGTDKQLFNNQETSTMDSVMWFCEILKTF